MSPTLHIRELLAFAKRNRATEVHLKDRGPIEMVVDGIIRKLSLPELGPGDVASIVENDLGALGSTDNQFEVEGFGLIRAHLKPGEARLVLIATSGSGTETKGPSVTDRLRKLFGRK